MAFTLFGKKYFTAAAATHTGLVRKENQDSWCCMPAAGLFAVSDGMGGGEGGELASAMVIDMLRKAGHAPLREPAAAAQLAYEADAKIQAYAEKNHLRGMGATVIALLFDPFQPDKAMLFYAGDSRCYRLRGRTLEQLSSDHTVAGAMGIPEERLARKFQGVLTNAVGCGANFFVETRELELREGDLFLLCSDGVYRLLGDDGLKQVLGSGAPPAELAETLVKKSLDCGGVDNATAVVVSLGRLPEISEDVLKEKESTPSRAAWEEGNDADDAVTPPTE
ncbi:MAG: serine/threonine-protein phosphatase [Lentisphaeria bacterium]|nr:serine/threonine-protein phosphatase [Lentisphaeria bacterium]